LGPSITQLSGYKDRQKSTIRAAFATLALFILLTALLLESFGFQLNDNEWKRNTHFPRIEGLFLVVGHTCCFYTGKSNPCLDLIQFKGVSFFYDIKG